MIKADIGSIGGHIRPSAMILDCVRRHVQAERGRMLIDCHIGATGDDIAILMTHTRGAGDARIHELVSCP